MLLRPYQADAIAAARNALNQGIKNPLICLPTGSGKSLVISTLAQILRSSGRCVTILSHTQEILSQLAQTYERIANESPAIYSASLGSKEVGPITFAQIQSAANSPGLFCSSQVVLIDECDRVPVDGDGQYLSFIDTVRRVQPNLRVVGFTATPYRLGTGLCYGPGSLFDSMVYDANVGDLIKEGYLCPLRTKQGTAPDLSGVHVRAGEYVSSELELAMSDRLTIEAGVNEILRWGQDRHSWLLFCSGVKHAQAVQSCLKVRGVDGVVVTGETPQAQRSEAIAGFRDGRIKCLLNINTLSVGFDAPNVDLIAMMRPTQSPGLYYQQCLDLDTEVLTSEGWKFRDQVTDNSEIACWKDGAVSFHKPDDIVRRPLGSEHMYSFKNSRVDFRVTAGHNMVVKTKKAFQFRTAEQCADYKTAWDIPLCGTANIPDAALTDQEVALLGWFFSDGHFNKHCNCLNIAQSATSPYLSEIEQILTDCGLAWGKTINKRAGKFSKYADNVLYYVTAGTPRIRKGRGCGHLKEWLVRGANKKLHELSVRQFAIFLNTMNHGDGCYKTVKDYSPTGIALSMGDDKELADLIQAMAVVRGYRASVGVTQPKPSEWNAAPKPMHMLRISPVKTATIGGTHDAVCIRKHDGHKIERTKMIKEQGHPWEEVWCVTVPTGAMIVRRNGKAYVIGNCGRGLRKHPSKSDTLLLDLASNIERHGPIDTLNSRIEKRSRVAGAGQAPVKVCPGCCEIVHASVMKCPSCGNVWTRELAKHGTVASNLSVLSEVTVQNVTKLRLGVNSPADRSRKQTLRVEYFAEGDVVNAVATEFLSFDTGAHPHAYAQAIKWLRDTPGYEQTGLTIDDGKLMGKGVHLKTVLDVVPFAKNLPTPKAIKTMPSSKNPKYRSVIGRVWE